MKTIIRITLFLCFAVLAGFKTADKNLVHSISAQPFFEEDEEEFVELMDGKIIKGDVTKCNVYKTSSFKKEGSGGATIDGVSYKSVEIKAVHFKKKFYRKTEYGEFAVRVSEGRINKYINTVESGSQNINHYYVQKGDRGPLVTMAPEYLRTMVSDYAPAIAVLDIFENQTEKERRRRKIPVTFECVEVYNSQ